MIAKKKIAQLRRVFSDADLVDVDLSEWQRGIGLHVIADHLPSSVRGRRAFVAVRFSGVRRFDWSFHHHRHRGSMMKMFPFTVNPNQHLKWNIYEMSIVPGKITRITLSSGEKFPVLRIAFEDVVVEAADYVMFDEVNPDWVKPEAGLGRPGIERLHQLLRRSTPHGGKRRGVLPK